MKKNTGEKIKGGIDGWREREKSNVVEPEPEP
jgi:hypothetical protein